MATRITEFRATAKAWIGAAIAGLTGLSTVVVVDSTPGRLIAAGLGFLTALYAVFQVRNKDVPPERVVPAENPYQY